MPTYALVPIDEASIRANNEVIFCSTDKTLRTAGSVLEHTGFDEVDFEGAEFFYPQTIASTELTPVLDTGIFTGFFSVTGSANNSIRTYLHDVVNDLWYDMEVETIGNKIEITKSNIINAELSSSYFVTGKIYGDPGETVSGTGITFSNNGGSTWNPSAVLIPGTTLYRKSVTSASVNESITTVDIDISDGVVTHSTTVDVLTKHFAPLGFPNASESITFAENTLTVIVQYQVLSAEAITYTLTGPDSALFVVDPDTGEITPAGLLSYETNQDDDSNGIYEFTLVATTASETASVDISATITNVAEHQFVFSGMTDAVGVAPESTVIVSSQLTGGIAGLSFSVVGAGLESSTNGGVTYSTTAKPYVVGQTYIRSMQTAAATYNTTVTINGSLTWSSGTDSIDIEYDIVTKAPLIEIITSPSFSVEHVESTNAVNVDLSPIAGDAPFSYSITGGADAGLFSINASGVLRFIEAPIFDGGVGADNEYIVIVTVANDDGYQSSSDTTAVIITVVSSGLIAEDIPDLSINAMALSDGTWVTDPTTGMSVIGMPSGVGVANTKSYHDIISHVRYLKVRTVKVSLINVVNNGTADIVFGGDYITATPDGNGDMTISLTVEDDLDNTLDIDYTIEL